MINQDFIIDFDNKRITHKGSSKTTYAALDFYSYLQDIFDEPENMKYEIPIVANSKDQFELINGWTIDQDGLKSLRGKLVTTWQSS